MFRPIREAVERHQTMAADRMKTCRGCSKLQGNMRCEACGCFMPAKVHIPVAKCPDGKWSN